MGITRDIVSPNLRFLDNQRGFGYSWRQEPQRLGMEGDPPSVLGPYKARQRGTYEKPTNHIQSFIECIRSRKQPVCNAELALDAPTGRAIQAPRQVTEDRPDVDNYDACYLPDGRIIFSSTAAQNVCPCWGRSASHSAAALYLLDPADGRVRQLCFDQDHNWCPTVINDGRVLYLRWEYTDAPHFFTRLLFTMNPDGTEQTAYYGSNSYWPNAVFDARPIPGHPSRLVGVVGGHHGSSRAGELVLFDTAEGQAENEGTGPFRPTVAGT